MKTSAKFLWLVRVAVDVVYYLNATKNSGYFPACNADVMMKITARPVCTRTKGCSLARETNKNKTLDPYSGGSLCCQVCVFKLGQ